MKPAIEALRRYPRLGLFLFALLVRIAFVTWARGRFPAAADGTYYDILAKRIAEGAGYTWRWPDGVVTYAAHYPVGYPALLAIAYEIFGAIPASGMWMNALFGALAAPATYELVGARTGRRGIYAGLLVSVHPALVPYTAALMTEGVVTALLVSAAALATRKERSMLALLGVTFGLMTLMRPQMLLLAPVFGLLSGRGGTADSAASPRRGYARAWARAALVTALALFVCLPWTARNCKRMDQCVFVSANGGTNLLIGAESTEGGWHEVPRDACPGVFGEVAKDVCFGKVAKERIARAPGAFLAKIPRKLSMTFDYFGAGPYYLHASNPDAFPYEAKVKLGAIETFTHRATLVAGLVCLALTARLRRRAVRALAAIGVVTAFLPGVGVVAHLSAALAWLLGEGGRRRPLLFASVVVATAVTHAVFFGAGRYGLPLVPFVVAFAFRPPPKPEAPREPCRETPSLS